MALQGQLVGLRAHTNLLREQGDLGRSQPRSGSACEQSYAKSGLGPGVSTRAAGRKVGPRRVSWAPPTAFTSSWASSSQETSRGCGESTPQYSSTRLARIVARAMDDLSEDALAVEGTSTSAALRTIFPRG